MAKTVDILVRNEGTVFTFLPLTPKADKWIEENVQTESWQRMRKTLVVDWRFAEPLVQGMKNNGLRVK